MKSKLVYYFPIAIFVFGLIWSVQTVSNKPGAYYFGMALGFVLVTAIPSFIIALIHYLLARNTSKAEQEENFGIIDAEAAIVKRNYWYYFFNYLAIIGLFVCMVIVMQRSGIF